MRFESHSHTLHIPVADMFHQQVERLLPELLYGLADIGHRRAVQFESLAVVETHHPDLLRNLYAKAVEHLQA